MKIFLIVLYTIMSIIAVLGADPMDPKEALKSVNKGFSLELSFEKPKDIVTNGLVVKCVIRNNSSYSMVYAQSNNVKGFRLTAKDFKNKDIGYTEYGEKLINDPKNSMSFTKFEPGDAMEASIRIDKAFKLSSKGIKSMELDWRPYIRRDEQHPNEYIDAVDSLKIHIDVDEQVQGILRKLKLPQS